MEEIAKLFTSIGFKVDDKELVSFTKNLTDLETRLKGLRQSLAKAVTLNAGVNKKSLNAVGRDLRAAIKTAGDGAILKIGKVTVPIKAIQDKLNARPVKLAFQTPDIKITDVRIPKRSLALAFSTASTGLRLDINNLRITQRNLQLALTKASANVILRLTKIMVPVQELRASLAQATAGTPLRITKVFITKAALREAFRNAAHNQTLRNFQVDVKVDAAVLRASIDRVLAGYRGRLNLNAGGGSGGSRGSAGFGHAGLAGGLGGLASRGMTGVLPGFGLGYGVTRLNKINQEMQGQTLAMTSVMGGQEAGAREQAWLRSLANTVGFDYRQTQPAFTRMMSSGTASGLESGQVRNIFQGVSEYGRVMGLDTESMQGSMRAIEQMLNKNQVMSEELKGQLAERMPGVISAMAEAAGFGTDADSQAKLFKAMESGQVKSTEVLEKFAAVLSERARAGGALEKAMKSTAAEQARFNNAFSGMVEAFAAAGFDETMAGFFRQFSEGLEGSANLVRLLGENFRYLTAPLEAVVGLIEAFSKHLPDMATALGVSESAILGIATAATLAMIPFGPMVMAISALLLVAEDLYGYTQGKDSMIGRMLDSINPETSKAIKDFGTEVARLVGSLVELGKMSFEGWGKILKLFEDDKSATSFIEQLTSIVKLINDLTDAIIRLKETGSFDGFADALTPKFDPKKPVNFRNSVMGEVLARLTPYGFVNDTILGNSPESVAEKQMEQRVKDRAEAIQPLPSTLRKWEAQQANLSSVTVNVNGAGDAGAVAREVVQRVKQELLAPATAVNGGDEQ